MTPIFFRFYGESFLELPWVNGIYTDRCLSSTVRSLADERFDVVVVEDCCAAGTDERHHRELEISNMIYCHVLSTLELQAIMGLAWGVAPISPGRSDR